MSAPTIRRLTLGADVPAERLAHQPGAQGSNNLVGANGVERLPQHRRPALLVSYVYAKKFLEQRHKYAYRDWALDSGAFSAFKSGTEVRLADFTRVAKELSETDPTLSDIFALDVIGDWRKSLSNAEAMWAAGVEAIPCWHAGEPWDLLVGLARDYPKVALGGLVPLRGHAKRKVVAQAFARIWPKKIHGFGIARRDLIIDFPFHSVDATNWELAPCKFGSWKGFGGEQLSIRGGSQNLRSEVEFYLRLEAEAQSRWSVEFERLGWIGAPPPSVMLGVQAGSGRLP